MTRTEPSATSIPAFTPGLTLRDFQRSGAARFIADQRGAWLRTLHAQLLSRTETAHEAQRSPAQIILLL